MNHVADIIPFCYFSGYFQETLFEEIKELQFVAAEAEVIQAVDLCVVLMNTGEIAEIMADPEMAYGKFCVTRIFRKFILSFLLHLSPFLLIFILIFQDH